MRARASLLPGTSWFCATIAAKIRYDGIPVDAAKTIEGCLHESLHLYRF